MTRLLIESHSAADAERTAAALEEEVRDALAKHPSWKKKVLLLSNELPGIRMLRGMERRHILMKLLTGEDAEALCAFLSEKAAFSRDNCQITYEYNPTSMI